MSREAHEAIAKAEAEGMVFTDSPSSSPVVSDSISADSAPKQKKDSARVPGTFSGPTPAQLFDGGWYIEDEGKVISLSGAEVCRTKGCMVSLDWHRCATPVFPNGKGEFIPVHRKVG
jgi:hypothetical protein